LSRRQDNREVGMATHDVFSLEQWRVPSLESRFPSPGRSPPCFSERDLSAGNERHQIGRLRSAQRHLRPERDLARPVSLFSCGADLLKKPPSRQFDSNSIFITEQGESFFPPLPPEAVFLSIEWRPAEARHIPSREPSFRRRGIFPPRDASLPLSATLVRLPVWFLPAREAGGVSLSNPPPFFSPLKSSIVQDHAERPTTHKFISPRDCSFLSARPFFFVYRHLSSLDIEHRSQKQPGIFPPPLIYSTCRYCMALLSVWTRVRPNPPIGKAYLTIFSKQPFPGMHRRCSSFSDISPSRQPGS